MNLRPVASMDDTAPKLIHSPLRPDQRRVQTLPQDFWFSEKLSVEVSTVYFSLQFLEEGVQKTLVVC